MFFFLFWLLFYFIFFRSNKAKTDALTVSFSKQMANGIYGIMHGKKQPPLILWIVSALQGYAGFVSLHPRRWHFRMDRRGVCWRDTGNGEWVVKGPHFPRKENILHTYNISVLNKNFIHYHHYQQEPVTRKLYSQALHFTEKINLLVSFRLGSFLHFPLKTS